MDNNISGKGLAAHCGDILCFAGSFPGISKKRRLMTRTRAGTVIPLRSIPAAVPRKGGIPFRFPFPGPRLSGRTERV